MVISDVDIEHVDRSIESRALVHKIVYDGIPTPLLAGDDDVDRTSFCAQSTFVAFRHVVHSRHSGNPVLETLRAPFQIPIAIKHVQKAIITVESFVLGEELVIHLRV